MAASRIFGKNAEMSRIWQPVEPKALKTSGNSAGLGDAVSATLFNLAQEILLIFLKEKNLIEHITVNKPMTDNTYLD